MEKRIPISEVPARAGKTVVVSGWVQARRDHGKLIFIDVRDRSGLLQVVFTLDNKDMQKRADQLRPEWVVSVTGMVNQRPKGMENSCIATGMVELLARDLIILAKAHTPPFAIDADGKDVNEELRLKYRYLDLRRQRMARNIIMRHETVLFMRNWLSKQGFIEIETPILTKSTPEGARDYVVPSRLYQGNFYALPQSPQQYKQLLMVAGFERYFQIARCFRDEDPRGDRQPEFTQLDVEMSFVQREDVMAVIEPLCIDMVKTLYPEKTIQEIPFPRMSYQEAMGKYHSDKPDLRKNKNDPDVLAFVWIVDFPFFKKVEKGNASHPEALAEGWTFTHNPFSAPKPEHMDWLMHKQNIGDILTTQYDLALNGCELGGGSIRNHTPEALQKVFEIMGYEQERIVRNFGHMLEAFSYGAPPHGGIALGLDRLLMLLHHEQNIREVMAFPKTGDARDPMMNSPSEIMQEQWKELGIELKRKNKKT